MHFWIRYKTTLKVEMNTDIRTTEIYDLQISATIIGVVNF